MSAKQFKVCLVSPGHLSSNPRLVKEANALAEAGYQVHVIYGNSFPPARMRDEAVLARAEWQVTRVSVMSSRCSHVWAVLRQRVAKRMFAVGLQFLSVAKLAHHPLVTELTAAALRTKADLYIGHCLAALPAVVAAGRYFGSRIGFDAEDFHSGEQTDAGAGRLANEIARVIERRLLPQCNYVSAASPLIGAAYAAVYGIAPVTLLNDFPLSEAVDPLPLPELPSFYWFSQTIGHGRGLEEFVEILRQMRRPCRLDLRGQVAEDYQRSLTEAVQGATIELRWLPPDLPGTMARHAAGYTAGLSLEQRVPVNRDLCLTNKAFTYLLAGIPVILSRTRAQELLASDLGPAALLLDLDAPAASAAILTQWLDDPLRQTGARAEAFRIGREYYNWDREKIKFIELVRDVLDA